MLELTVVAVRMLQYLGAAVLFGSSLFFVYSAAGGEPPAWARRLIAGAAVVVVIGSLGAIAAQASLFAGSFAAGLSSEAIGAVVSSMPFGKAALVRAIAAVAAFLVLMAARRGGADWRLAAGLGGVAAASLAWLGHGAATEGSLGWLHLVSNILHVLAASAWIGGLAVFTGLLFTATGRAHPATLHANLRRFSGLGSLLVAVLLLTGLINSWVLVGLDGAGDLFSSRYGFLLCLKLALFVAMLGLAALNRFRFTPALGRTPDASSVGALQRSIVFETALAVTVLAVVAWLGTLAPPGGA